MSFGRPILSYKPCRIPLKSRCPYKNFEPRLVSLFKEKENLHSPLLYLLHLNFNFEIVNGNLYANCTIANGWDNFWSHPKSKSVCGVRSPYSHRTTYFNPLNALRAQVGPLIHMVILTLDNVIIACDVTFW